ncbi:hypothetical protein J6590_019657 [Homalodisca vitripennis]|nr:hypothetical protein J6590_019657 [Homalodisca vitripennis]
MEAWINPSTDKPHNAPWEPLYGEPRTAQFICCGHFVIYAVSPLELKISFPLRNIGFRNCSATVAINGLLGRPSAASGEDGTALGRLPELRSESERARRFY